MPGQTGNLIRLRKLPGRLETSVYPRAARDPGLLPAQTGIATCPKLQWEYRTLLWLVNTWHY